MWHENPLHLKSLNHIFLFTLSVKKSIDFSQNVLVSYPWWATSFDFDGPWLLNHGIGIHLLKCEDPDKMPTINHINPRGNHISFQCESIITVERTLKEMKMDYVKCRVEEGEISVDQLFFHDPDGSMIEICNCEVLPLVPLAGDAIKHVQVSNANFSSCSCRFNKQSKRNNHHKWSNLPFINMKKDFLHFASEVPCTGNPFYTSHSCCMNN
ncbi:uncharacterized protein LOC116125872 [Pistacia vera]|uniref:uncharacterized protein LOC116125872 n=1 Tax=Pistacia vera TaxID=55513 RepID=UPI00126333E5|nr:uncharacterized protein LOC116125872 [Pistacia vera]